ncbi:MAG: hypothetical protein WED04_01785 [Promethearchaeati archaeon SRVP18_Atabeyarchaeia-1]
MSIVFTWRKRANIGLALMLIGLTGLVQSYVVFNAQTTLGITGIYLLALVPIGVTLALSGVELSVAETIYRWSYSGKRKTSKWKEPQRGGLRLLANRIETASVLSAILVLTLSFLCYFSVLVACVGTSIPLFTRFVLAESASMIAAVFLGILGPKII